MTSRNPRRRSSIVKTASKICVVGTRGRRVSRYERKAHAVGVPRRANDDGEGASLRAAGSKYYSPRGERGEGEVHQGALPCTDNAAIVRGHSFG